ncbi:type I restriction-modification system subunit M [Ruminiclostridium cellulolyticum]|uniref:site-specific DNA-methyltransferase (adenine-specific) n=1 Tax=Ruminiclostridium cellulolyticum (strain ATCC 35319 / DSM 5812 / JCM 6584 / H10) TaxID=394503 RepID=B8I7G5_RUMCH|nr:type I restriction-modification system subunit M [Ruminiclostridium cellulolyticum]ACL77036.1 type I restriction-modification system, M subunit [Ruminiclostridium cellulolyticum H10]
MSDLNNQLWASADILRGKMDASEYKNYLLGLIFYKYLSDQELRAVYEEEHGKVSEYPNRHDQLAGLLEWYKEDSADVKDIISKKLGYFIVPDYLFYTLRKKADEYELQISDLQNAFIELGRQGNHFTGLFDDIDLTSTKLGANAQQRNITITEVIKALDEIYLFGHDGDVIGDAYEYLIGQFAAGAGKKAGEFYTPQTVSKIISEIVSIGQEEVAPFHIYDPAMGSGSLMLNIRQFVKNPWKVHYHGQELNTTTYNLARMNLILHNVEQSQMRLRNGDTLDEDWPSDEPYLFNAVVMNPPYSANWSADDKFLSDPRFERYGKLAPKSKADFSFLLHGFYHLNENGTMGIVLPHGVLFRGASEGVIRKTLLEMGAIDAVIGLPANIFYGTSIPTTVLIMKKNRGKRDVLFIDASKDFEKQKNQNNLRKEDIQKIVDTYKKRESIHKYAHLADYDEIVRNEYNLNIPRYVDTFEEEVQIDIVALSNEMVDLNLQIKQKEMEFLGLLDDLAITDGTRELIEATKRIFT